MSRPARAWIYATLTCALWIGCQRQLDLDELRDVVAQGIEEQLDLTVASVECPESVAIEAGNAFDCTAQAEGGGVLQVAITQDDDAGNVSWEVSEMNGVLDLGLLEGQIQSGLAQQAQIESTVDCGPRFRAARTGDTFQCSVQDAAGNQGTVTVTVDDDEGNVSWALD